MARRRANEEEGGAERSFSRRYGAAAKRSSKETRGEVKAHTAILAKRRKKESASEMETRAARFVPKATSSVRERIARAFTHRLYLIDKKLSGESPLSCEFFVLGATGNVYTVTLGIIPSCTCLDHAKGNTCKHILFVILRVLKLAPDDPRIWQKALLPSELHALLHNLSVSDTVLASGLVRQRFKQITGECSAQDSEAPKPSQRVIEGDCPVCYEAMASSNGKALEQVVFCKSCGNNVHADCFKRWSQSRKHGHVTCMYCRALWEDDNKKVEGASSRGEYLNLASYSDAHRPHETTYEALYPESHPWWRRSR